MRILSIFILLVFFTSVAVSQSEYQIAYNVLENGEKDDYEVYVMNMDGTGKKNITNHKDVAWTYLAHNDKIFFISDRGACKRCYYLYEMDTDGKSMRKIYDHRLRDSWMGSRKNGRELIVSPWIKDGRAFHIFDVKTGKLIRELKIPLAYYSDPVFSPDGKQIVFRGSTEKRSKDSKTFDELYITNEDGIGLRRLTNYPKDDNTAKWHSYHAGPPRWNSKVNFITYQSRQNGKSSLFAVTPDGKKNWKLTDNDSLNEGWHDWSPDGKWLAIEMFDDQNKEFGIYLMNYQTKKVIKLTNLQDSRFQQAPVFVSNKY